MKSLEILFAIFVGLMLIILFWRNNLILFLIFALFFIPFVKLFYSKKNLLLFSLGAFFGTIGEIICIYFGVWSYSNPSFLIPIWLPFAWGYAIVLINWLVDSL